MRLTSKAVAGLALFAGAVALAGCGGSSSNDWSGPTVCIGALSPISVSKNEWEASNYAILMALEQANAAGGVTLGGVTHHLRLEVRDDRGDPAVGLAEIASLDAAGCRTIIGPAYSGVMLGPVKPYDGVTIDGVADYAIKNHLLLISQAATSPAITGLVDDRYVWRVAPSDALQGRVAAQYAYDALGARRIAIIHRDDAYGTGLRDAFAAAFTARGGAILTTAAYPVAATYTSANFTEQVAQAYGAAADRPDLVYLIAFRTDADFLTFALKDGLPQDGWRPTFMSSEGSQSQVFIDNAEPSIAEGLYGAFPSLPTGRAELLKFEADFQARFGYGIQSYTPQAYDATMLAVLAMQAAGSGDPSAMRLQLQGVSSAGAGKLQVGPGQIQSGLEALAAGLGVNYEGASGPIEFDAQGDPGAATYVVYRVQRAGSPATLQRVDLASFDVTAN
jgi:ABC-type branched-subunit amino acid transport system substrate-binding protein